MLPRKIALLMSSTFLLTSAYGQLTNKFTPLCVEYQDPTSEKPAYYTSQIATTNSGYLYWPVLDFKGTGLFATKPSTSKFSTGGGWRIRTPRKTDEEAPLIYSLQFFAGSLYVTGVDEYIFTGFIAKIQKDTVWFRYLPDFANALHSITVDSSGIYISANDGRFYKYDHNGNQIWSKNTITNRSIAIDDSYLYIAGWQSSRASIFRYNKESGTLIDTFTIDDSMPGDEGSASIEEIVRKDSFLYVTGGYVKQGEKAQLYVAKISTGFFLQWHRTWSASAPINGYACTLDSNGNLWSTDQKSLLAFSPNGDLLYSGSWDKEGYTIVTLTNLNNKIYAAGTAPGPPNPYIQKYSFLFMADIPTLLLGVASAPEKSLLKIFYQGKNLVATVPPEDIGKRYSVIDILGRTIVSGFIQQTEHIIDRNDLPAGVYLFQTSSAATTFVIN